MKHLLFALVLLIGCSCATVYFAAPQPTKGVVVKSFIADVQGTYADTLLTVTIRKNELSINGENYRWVLGPDSNQALVKYYNNYYFASFNDSIYYTVYMASFYENKLAVYMLNPDARSVDVIKRFTAVQPLNNEKGDLLIDPTAKEFEQLVENSVFDVVGVLQKLKD